MQAQNNREQPAPGQLSAVELFGSKWAVTVLDHLRGRVLRFTALRLEIGGISQKSLSATLKQLEQGGFLVRRAYAVIPPRVEYALTGAGEGLLEVLLPVRAYMRRQVPLASPTTRQFHEVGTDVRIGAAL
jgi:DNA-binding HxlR family transcriptional regulator